MGLGFLVPAFLAGLAAIALPVWVHLRNRPKTETVEFPSLMFLERIPYRSVQKQQLRHRFLFALRCLAIALLVLAFARPFLGSDVPAVLGSGAREIVILLDRSWSMGHGNTWDTAVNAARAEAQKATGTDRVSLIVFDEQAEVLVEGEPGGAAVETMLGGVGVSNLTTSYAAALRAAARVLATARLPNSEIVLISDFQRAGVEGERIEIDLPTSTVLRPVSVAEDLRDNRGIAELLLDRSIDQDGEQLRVTARMTRQGGTGTAQVPLVLEVGGQEVQTQMVLLPGDGAARVAFEPIAAADQMTVEVRLPADALAGDDIFRAVVPPGGAMSVLLLGNPSAGAGDSLYVARALDVGLRPAFAVEQGALRDLRPADLDGRDLVILNDVGSIDAGSAAVLRTYVENGGGLLLGWAELSDEGAAALTPSAPGLVVDRTTASGAALGFVDLDHPIFDAYRSPEAGDLSSARFYRYRAIEPAPEAGVLARFDDGAVALVEEQLGQGRVLIWTSSLDTFWTDFPLQPIFVPVVHEIAKYAGDYQEAETWRVATAESGPGFAEVPGIEGPTTVAVNLDRSEADLRVIDPQELLASVAWGSGAGLGSESGAAADIALVEAGQSIWWYLLVAAGALLLAESALSNRLSSRASWKRTESEHPSE